MNPGMVAFVVTSVLLPLALNEVRDWFPRLATGLVRWAARRLGDPQACARYEEEWVANIEAVPGKISPLASALGYLIELPKMRWTVRHAPRLVNSKPLQLPGNIRGFTGRVEVLAALDNLLIRARPKTRGSVPSIAVICGPAGTGKTSLAVHWAHRNKERFPDGILYVNLRGYSPGTPVAADDALCGFLRALGVMPADIPTRVDDRADLFRRLVSRRRLLIMLDNVATSRQVRPLLPSTSKCVVLVTSRASLASLLALHAARRITLGVLNVEEAMDMLEAVAGSERVDAESQAARELVVLCGCLPLAIRIAAERLVARPRTPISELVRDLRDESALWDALSIEDHDEANAVRTVFSWSYQALPSTAAQMFRRLALLTGNRVTLPEAATLVGGDLTMACQLLEILCGAHLLEKSRQPDVYQMHDLLRAYAHEQLEAEESELVRAFRGLTHSRAAQTAARPAPLPGQRRLGLRRPRQPKRPS